ncbi:MAG: helix-turn-helix domain-containing protein [Janthinobacterium lividum]
MAYPRTTSRTARPEAALRSALGLSQQQLADWLGCSRGFVNACEAGRKAWPLALTERLLPLLRVPPPEAAGSVAGALPPLPLGPTLPTLAWTGPPPPPATPDLLADAPPAPPELRTAARTARLAALVAEAELLRLHARALALGMRRRGLAALHAAPPPTLPAEAARWHTWLAALAADLALADPHPAQDAARRRVLAIRAATRNAEANGLLGIGSKEGNG